MIHKKARCKYCLYIINNLQSLTDPREKSSFNFHFVSGRGGRRGVIHFINTQPCVGFLHTFSMRKRFYNLIILPLVAVSALVLFIHDCFPGLYGDCVRPLVMMMRRTERAVSVQNMKVTKRPERSLCFSMVFDRERNSVIRLIRLDSDYDEPETDKYTLKESA